MKRSCLSLHQSNKKERDLAPEINKEMQPAALESSENPALSSSQLQPRPPSSPPRSESRRRSGKRHPKNRQAAADSAGVKGGDASTTASKTVGGVKGSQPPQEPTAIAHLPKNIKDAASAAEEDSKSARIPQTQRRDGDNGERRHVSDQAHTHGFPVAAAELSNKTQVREDLFFFMCLLLPHESLFVTAH